MATQAIFPTIAAASISAAISAASISAALAATLATSAIAAATLPTAINTDRCCGAVQRNTEWDRMLHHRMRSEPHVVHGDSGCLPRHAARRRFHNGELLPERDQGVWCYVL